MVFSTFLTRAALFDDIIEGVGLHIPPHTTTSYLATTTRGLGIYDRFFWDINEGLLWKWLTRFLFFGTVIRLDLTAARLFF
jgi:hypothetical protein